MRGVPVFRADGTRGAIISGEGTGDVVVEFTDGSQVIVPARALTLRQDGSYHLAPTPVGSEPQEVVIPVVAEELNIQTDRIARSKVHVRKRIETREEVVNAPSVHEEVIVEHVPINRYLDSEVPEVRDENGVLVIPVIEEVVVVQKKLLLREEVRVYKRQTTTNTPETVTLRREVVDIEREELIGKEFPHS